MNLFGLNGDEVNLEEVRKLVTSRDYRHLHPKLLERWKELVEACARKFPDRELLVTCVYRSPEEQWKLWRQGRFSDYPGPLLVDCDGRSRLSPLNYYPSRGLHAILTNRGLLVEDEPPYYPVGCLARQCGLVWRGIYDESRSGMVTDKTLFELADA
jgi:hypothetical protein